MDKYKYRLYCTECEKVTPHEQVTFSQGQTRNVNILNGLLNNIFGLFFSTQFRAPQGDKKCVNCGNNFHSPNYLG